MQEAYNKITTEDGFQASVDKVTIDVADDASIQAAYGEIKSKLQGAALDVLVVRTLSHSAQTQAYKNKPPLPLFF